MSRLTLRRRRRTKLDTVKDLAQLYTTLKVSQAGGRAAKKAAKGYAGVKAAKGGRKVVGPALAAIGIGGLVAFLKKRNRQPTGYEPPPGSSPGSTPSAYPSGSDVTPQPSSGPAPAGEPEAPTGPPATGATEPSPGEGGGGPQASGAGEGAATTDLDAGSIRGRESFPLGSSVSAEESAPAGSAAAPKSGTTEAGEEKG
jgi:hypothetical protein